MKKIKPFIFLAITILLFGCRGDAQRTDIINKDYQVDFLFENDGCKIYRFFDGGYAIYYNKCNTGQSTVQYHTGGKNDHLVVTNSSFNNK